MQKRKTISQRSELIYDIHNFGINADTRELFINPDNGAEYDNAEIDHRVASMLIKNIRFLDSFKLDPIVIHMCSCGGIWEYGLAIYDAIMSTKSEVYIVAYAHARSMSSIILQAGDYRILSPNAYFMIHTGTDSYHGTTQGLITHAQQAQKSCEKMLDIYVDSCAEGPYFKQKKNSVAQIRTFLKKQMNKHQEWYMLAEEAVEYGFCDYILGDSKCPDIGKIINPA